MKITIKNDRISAEKDSKTIRSESIKNIVRIIQLTTGDAVFANDQDFHIFEIRNEFWVPQAIDFESNLNELEHW